MKEIMNLSSIQSKAEFIATLNPKAWEIVGGPPVAFGFTDAHVDLLVADVVKSIGAKLSDRKLGKKVADLSHKMGTQATHALMASWEDGDLCPPWRWPWPGPHPWQMSDLLRSPHPEPWQGIGLSPQPEPWEEITSAEQIGLAYVLTQLSGLTTSKEFNRSLKTFATAIASSVAKALADDFERCGTVPRPPFPGPRPNVNALLSVPPALAARARSLKSIESQ